MPLWLPIDELHIERCMKRPLVFLKFAFARLFPFFHLSGLLLLIPKSSSSCFMIGAVCCLVMLLLPRRQEPALGAAADDRLLSFSYAVCLLPPLRAIAAASGTSSSTSTAPVSSAAASPLLPLPDTCTLCGCMPWVDEGSPRFDHCCHRNGTWSTRMQLGLEPCLCLCSFADS